MKALIILSLSLAVFLTLGIDQVFAQTTYVINMPTGSSSPDAPYFWQSEKDGDTSGKITIEVLDSVEWANADTAPHTVTSGSPQEGPDEKFDSGLFSPGTSFTHQFREVGSYDYFCMVHPWMVGTVFVQEAMGGGVKVLHGVGADVDEDGKGVNVEYVLDRSLGNAAVDTSANTITFILAGQIGEDELVIMLPEELIENPNAVWVDDEQMTNFETEKSGEVTKLTIPLEEGSEEVVIRGSAVIPEFGTITVVILAMAVIGTILFTTKSRIIKI